VKKISLSVLALGFSGGVAMAHPGDHVFSAAGTVVHLLTEPDHLAMAAAAALAAFLLWRWRKSET
jgi:hypothetical protein